MGGTSLTLGIWDTAGAERYESMSRIYYRAAKAAVVCYDLTNRSSFDKVKFWVEELLHNEDGCDLYIVGTKGLSRFCFSFSNLILIYLLKNS